MKFSIIIPVYNDAKIKQCLESLQSLDYDKTEYEIIVVNNNCPHEITKIIDSFPVKHIIEKIPGSYIARNTGIQQAQGEIIAFTDSDCKVSSDWLINIENVLQNKNISGVMGYSAGDNQNKIAEYEQTMYEDNIANFTNQQYLKRIDTRNFAIRKNVYTVIGGFKEELQYGGDMEYGARAHQAGFKIIFSKQVKITHTNPTNLSSLLKKRIEQNYGNMKLLDIYRDDKKFIKNYFPHLLRYQIKLTTRILRLFFLLKAKFEFPISNFICKLLPGKIGYFYFKLKNIIAMRLGQLNYIYKNEK